MKMEESKTWVSTYIELISIIVHYPPYHRSEQNPPAKWPILGEKANNIRHRRRLVVARGKTLLTAKVGFLEILPPE
jgi:hypothetical protein